ncbi:hypothetical protein ACFPRL_09655 [Pseudoclavibacter helvolus]
MRGHGPSQRLPDRARQVVRCRTRRPLPPLPRTTLVVLGQGRSARVPLPSRSVRQRSRTPSCSTRTGRRHPRLTRLWRASMTQDAPQ